MKTLTSTASFTLLYMCLTLSPLPSFGQVTLTGILQQGTLPNGQTAGTPIWNTLGNEVSYANLYVTLPNAGYSAPFLNHGNGAATSISYNLTPGTFQFYLFSDSLANNNPGNYGINLFFDGNNNTSPGIAAFSPSAVMSANAVPTGLDTLPLSGNTNVPNPAPGTLIFTDTPVPAPGSLTYIADGLSVTLTGYGFGVSGAFGGPAADRVGNLNDAPDGQVDGVGFFALTVAPVPEPSTSAIAFASALIVVVVSLTAKQPRSGRPGKYQ